MNDELEKELRKHKDELDVYYRDKYDNMTSAVSTAIDITGSLATQLNDVKLRSQRNEDRIINLESIAGGFKTQVDLADDDLEDHNDRLRDVEKWQWRMVGMFAVIVFEIPIAIGLIYFLLK